MRAIIQRVLEAKVEVDDKVVSQIGRGLLIYLSVGKADTEADVKFIAEKLAGLRIFEDRNGKMNLSLSDIAGRMLVVSNFTLHADCRKGRRPTFDAACEPAEAKRLFDNTIELLRQQGLDVQTGVFGAQMYINSINDGPINFLIDTSRLF